MVSLGGIPSLGCVDHSKQLGVICKLAESALNPTIQVIDKGVEEHQAHGGPVGGHHLSLASTRTQSH